MVLLRKYDFQKLFVAQKSILVVVVVNEEILTGLEIRDLLATFLQKGENRRRCDALRILTAKP